MMELLLDGCAWVRFIFNDGTVQTIYTTLNDEVLKRYGVSRQHDRFFDLQKLQFVDFREDACSVEVSAEKPEFDTEVLRFASRFI